MSKNLITQTLSRIFTPSTEYPELDPLIELFENRSGTLATEALGPDLAEKIESKNVISTSRRAIVAPEDINPAWIGGYWRAGRDEYNAVSGGSPVTGSGTIARLEDSISGLNLTQATGENRPTKTTWRGLDAIQFSDGLSLRNSAFNVWLNRTGLVWIACLADVSGAGFILGDVNGRQSLYSAEGVTNSIAIFYNATGAAQNARRPNRNGQMVEARFNGMNGQTNASRLKLFRNKSQHTLTFSETVLTKSPAAGEGVTDGLYVGDNPAGGGLSFKLLALLCLKYVPPAETLEGLSNYFADEFYTNNNDTNIFCCGDSNTVGYNENLTVYCYPHQLALRLDGNSYDGINDNLIDAGRPTNDARQFNVFTIAEVGAWVERVGALMTAQGVKRVDEWGRNIAVVNVGTNDLYYGATSAPNGKTGAQLVTALNSLVTDLQSNGMKVLVCSFPSRTDLPDGTTQTTYNTERSAFLTAFRSGGVIADGLCDIAADPRMADPTNTTYFINESGTFVHLSRAGREVWAECVMSALAQL